MIRRLAFAVGALLLGIGALGISQTAAMADDVTVESLLKDGYSVAGVVPSQAGPGVFLHKGGVLMVCFVAEKPGASVVATQYCKPVR